MDSKFLTEFRIAYDLFLDGEENVALMQFKSLLKQASNFDEYSMFFLLPISPETEEYLLDKMNADEETRDYYHEMAAVIRYLSSTVFNLIS